MFKTFTRKRNAIEAASRDLAKLDPSIGLGQYETEALGKDGEFYAQVTLMRGTQEKVEKLKELLPQYSFKFFNAPEETNVSDTDTATPTAAEDTPTAAPLAKAKATRAVRKKEREASADGTESKARGIRTSSFAGKTLTPIKKDADGNFINPRRAGSHGYNSMAVIIAKPGITYEDFVSAGGRLTDLRWDVEHGNVEAV